MARKNDSPQEEAMREMMRDYLKNNDSISKNGMDVAIPCERNGEYELQLIKKSNTLSTKA